MSNFMSLFTLQNYIYVFIYAYKI